MPTELEELVSFLEPGGMPQVRGQALDIVEGLSGSDEGAASLRSVATPLLQNLFKCVANVSLSRSALTALVNLSQDTVFLQNMLELGACNRVMDYVRENLTVHHDLVVMLLSNITRTQMGATQMLQVGEGAKEYANMRKLLAVALNPGASDAMYEHVAGVICNVANTRPGRQFLTSHGLGALPALADMLCSRSEVKRTRAASTLKNLSITAEREGYLEALTSDSTTLEKWLVPINGVKPTEGAASVREDMANAVAVLAASDRGREALLGVNAAEVLKQGYEYEEHPGTMQAMERAARLFMGVEGCQDEDDDANVQDAAIVFG